MSRDDIAKSLVESHVSAEREIVLAAVYARAEGEGDREPIKLLEVNRATVAAGVIPVYFGETKDHPAVVIIEVTEDEYLDLKRGSLSLPDGWDVPTVLFQRAA